MQFYPASIIGRRSAAQRLREGFEPSFNHRSNNSLSSSQTRTTNGLPIQAPCQRASRHLYRVVCRFCSKLSTFSLQLHTVGHVNFAVTAKRDAEMERKVPLKDRSGHASRYR